jgi:hypothetical protein
MHHGKRVEVPAEAALALALEGRKKYPDHTYEVRPIPVDELSPTRLHLLRQAIRNAERLS